VNTCGNKSNDRTGEYRINPRKASDSVTLSTTRFSWTDGSKYTSAL
jgi:hypothetical protein